METTKILWIEDDEDIIESLRPFLEREGWQLSTAPSAQEGKALVPQLKPDVIIMDIIMEGEHGFSAIEDLKSDPDARNVPVIIFSSVTHRWRETKATRRDALTTEANDFVDKIEGPKALIEALRRALAA